MNLRYACAALSLIAGFAMILSAPGFASDAVQTVSARAEVGKKAPDFSLKDTAGKEHRLIDYLAQGKTVVLEWFNPDCPFVRRHHEKEKTMKRIEEQFRAKGVVWLAINSGAPGNQGAGLERNAKAKKEYGIDYPILIDESGSVGRSYEAKTTPHMFIIAKDGTVAYAGAIDDDPRGSKSERVNHLAAALAACVGGQPVSQAKTDPYGCSVKYGTPAAK